MDRQPAHCRRRIIIETNNAAPTPGLGRLLTALLCALATSVHADLIVPTASTVSLGGGSMDLACTDVVISGTLDLQGGSLANVRNVSINAGGALVAGSGSITLAGNWTNAGSFTAGTGSVNFIDAPTCAVSSTLTGNTTFATLTFISSTGKPYRFAAGSTQTITTQLTATGTQALPLPLQSATPGQPAFINLLGQQTMSELAVTDLTATGIRLAPQLTNRNLSPTAGAIGWFAEAPQIVPTLSQSLIIALGALLLSLGLRTQQRRSTNAHTNVSHKHHIRNV
jgi:hypothetical protein